MNQARDTSILQKHPNCRSILCGWEITGLIPLIILILTNCSSSRMFSNSAGEYERQQVHTYPFDSDTVWKSALEAVADYRLHTKDRENGVLLTWWKSTIMNEVGALSERNNFIHGVKIEDRTDGGPQKGSEFELQNRLEIRMTRNSNSTTTVTVKNIFKVTPYDLTPNDNTNDRFANKVFSHVEFDPREEYRILNRIEEIALKAKR